MPNSASPAFIYLNQWSWISFWRRYFLKVLRSEESWRWRNTDGKCIERRDLRIGRRIAFLSLADLWFVGWLNSLVSWLCQDPICFSYIYIYTPYAIYISCSADATLEERMLGFLIGLHAWPGGLSSPRYWGLCLQLPQARTSMGQNIVLVLEQEFQAGFPENKSLYSGMHLLTRRNLKATMRLYLGQHVNTFWVSLQAGNRRDSTALNLALQVHFKSKL